MDELDRILDRDDVIAARAIDEIDEGAERRRFAGSRGTGNEDQPLVQLTELLDFGRDPHLLDGDYRGGNLAKHGGGAAAVLQRVGAKAREPFELVRVVGVVRLEVFAPVALRHDRPQHGVEALRLEDRFVQARHLAVQAKDGRFAAAQMQVRGTLLDHRAK